MKKTIQTLIIIFLLLGAAVLQAQTTPVNMGTSWLRIPDNAREGAMAETSGALPDDADGAAINPAQLGIMGGSYFSATHSFWIQDLSMDHIVFTTAGGGEGFFVGGDYVNFGSIATYNVVGSSLVPTGSYTPIAVNGFAAYGMGLGRGFHAGITGHFIYDNIQQNQPDQTASFDLGFLYQKNDDPLALSVVLANLGFSIDDSLLPLEMKTSASGQILFEPRVKHHYLTLASETDLLLSNQQFTNVGFGGEYWHGQVAMRAGYRFINNQDLSGVTGLTAGVGLLFGDWQLDYSFMTLGDLGNSNQIELTLKMGSEATPTPTPAPPTPTPTPMPLMTPTPLPTPIPPLTLSFMEYYRLGLQAYDSKQYQLALNNWFKAIVIHDTTVKAFYYAEACAMIGVVYKFNLPNRYLSHQFCNMALRIDPTTETAKKLKHEIDSSSTRVENEYWEAEDAFERGHYEDSALQLKRLIYAKDPTTPSFYYTETYSLLGVIYQYHLNKPALAYRYYKEALKVDPKAKVANENIGAVAPDMGK